LLEAQRRLRAGDAAGAEPILREALRLAPDHAAVNNLLGVALGRLGRTVEGEALIRRALFNSPRDPGIWLNLGNRLHEQGRAGEAADAFAEADHLAPGRSITLSAWMRALTASGQREEAADVADTLVGVTEDPELLAGAVEVLSGANRLESALGALERALAERPERTDWWLRAATLAHDLHRLNHAAWACERVIELEPEQAEAWTLLASCHLYQGDFVRMADFLERAPADAKKRPTAPSSAA
jgi:predicted Zn-dependent protease